MNLKAMRYRKRKMRFVRERVYSYEVQYDVSYRDYFYVKRGRLERSSYLSGKAKQLYELLSCKGFESGFWTAHYACIEKGFKLKNIIRKENFK